MLLFPKLHVCVSKMKIANVCLNTVYVLQSKDAGADDILDISGCELSEVRFKAYDTAFNWFTKTTNIKSSLKPMRVVCVPDTFESFVSIKLQSSAITA